MTTQSVPANFSVVEKLASLEEALVSKTPGISTLCRDIHRELKSDPDCVTLLSEEQVSVLVRGLKHHTSTEIATKAIKKAPKVALKNVTEDML